MDFSEVTAKAFATIDENDYYKASKRHELKNWCYTFFDLFNPECKHRLEFILDVLSDNECWEKADSIHLVKLNRRIIARKIIQELSPSGITNPMKNIFRYQMACWCCLEEDITALFEEMKLKFEIGNDNALAVKKIMKSLCRDRWSDTLTMYWSHLVGGCESELQSSSKHLYEYGLELVINKYTCYVEGIEYFWKKIKSLPEEELSKKQKNEIFMKTTLQAAGSHLRRFPEIFEFCIRQVKSDMHYEFLKREFYENDNYNSLFVLQDNLCFDQFKKLFDCLEPADVSEKMYHNWLLRLEIEEYDEYYTIEAVKLFMHMWRRKGYDSHRNRVLSKELTSLKHQGTLLVPLVKKNYMEAVWAVLEKAYPGNIEIFLNSVQGYYICTVLEKRDLSSYKRLLSYKSIEWESNESSNADSDEEPYAKRRKI